MKTLAIFTGYYLPHLGGVERYVSKLSEELISRGYRIVIVTSQHADLPVYEKKGNLSIYRLPIIGLFKTRYPIPAVLSKEYRDVRKRLATENIDHVILNTRFHLTSLVGARLARTKHIDPLLIDHGTAHFSVGVPVLDFFGKGYEHCLTTVIKLYVRRYYGVSKKCNEWLGHFGITARGVFYNAVDPKDGKVGRSVNVVKIPKDTIAVTFAGRLIKEKGILNLIEAFERIAPGNATLLIAGDGPLRAEIARRIETNNHIKQLGYLNFDEMKSLYRRTDIFVHPSLFPEGLPTSILEAALMKCAIIATPKGGTKEVIVSPGHGIIVDGSVSSLVRALRSLLSDASKRDNLAREVYQKVRRDFTWSAVADTVEKELNRK